MDKATKNKLMKQYGRQDGDTGSPEVQIAILSRRISELTEHLRNNKKDHSTRRGLLGMVSRRRRLLKYLNAANRERFHSLTSELKIRQK